MRWIINVTLVYCVARFIVVLAVMNSIVGHFALEHYSHNYRWARTTASFELRSDIGEVLLVAASPQGAQDVAVFVNGGRAATLRLTPDAAVHRVPVAKAGLGNNEILLAAEKVLVPGNGDERRLSWLLWNVRTAEHYEVELINPQGFFDQTDTSLGDRSPFAVVKECLIRWDAIWFNQIAASGYSYTGSDTLQQNIVFYPAYPLVTGLVSRVLGLTVADGSLLTSLVFGYLFVLLFYRIGLKVGLKPGAALTAVALFSVNPFAVFLSSAYSETLFLPVSAVTILLLWRKQYWLAAAVGGSLTAMRNPGLIFPVIFLAHYAIIYKESIALRQLPRLAAMLALCVWGKLAFMLYLLVRFGNPFAAETAQKAFQPWAPASFGELLANVKNYFTASLLDKPLFFDPSNIALLLFYLYVATLAVWYVSIGRRGMDDRHKSLLVWATLPLLCPIANYSARYLSVFALGRYMLAVFAWYLLYMEAAEDYPGLTVAFLLLSVLAMAMLAVFFAQPHVSPWVY